MDDLTFEFLNIILPASYVEQRIEDMKDVVMAKDIDTELSDNILKAELYVATLASQDIEINVSLIKNISKIVYKNMYSWAGKINTKARTKIDILISTISTKWEDALFDKDLQLDLMAYSYHTIIKTRAFFDGNEVVARLFVNYLALRFGYIMFDVMPKDSSKLEDYKNDLKLADKGNLTKIRERIEKEIFFKNEELGPSGYVGN
jgi:fido (protein-threonine AMPylation protein)